jgi:hypothetical protein
MRLPWLSTTARPQGYSVVRMFSRSKLRPRRLLFALYLAARYYAAFTLLSYGFAKVMGAQFTVLDSQLARPMGEVSGFWLTWYYFGYSATYAAIIAWTQICGAVLLCFRRTALLGAILLLPVALNIVAIDVWVIRWSFSNGALRNALFVLGALCIVVSFHAPEIWRFLRKEASLGILSGRAQTWSAMGQLAIVAAMIAYTAHQGYWLANVNNRAPTPIDGAWHVMGSASAPADLPEWIYFEYNRAHMAVFQFSNGSFETRDFRVNPQAKTLTITQRWLNPASQEIFRGTWIRDGNRMTLQGVWEGAKPVRITFQREPMHIKDHQ